MAAKSVKIKFVTPATSEWLFCYTNVFEAKALDAASKPKYSVCVLIPKTDEAGLAAFKQGFEACKEANKSMLAGANGAVPAKFKNELLKDGDEAVANGAGEEFAGHYFFNAYADPEYKKEGLMVVDSKGNKLNSTTFYSGCYGRILGVFYAYNTGASKGISFGLNALCKTKEGENNYSGAGASLSDFGIESPFDSGASDDSEADF